MKSCLKCNTELLLYSKYCHMCGTTSKLTIDCDVNYESKTWFNRAFDKLLLSSPELLLAYLSMEIRKTPILTEQLEIEELMNLINKSEGFYINKMETILIKRYGWTKDYLINNRMSPTKIKIINDKWEEDKRTQREERMHKKRRESNENKKALNKEKIPERKFEPHGLLHTNKSEPTRTVKSNHNIQGSNISNNTLSVGRKVYIVDLPARAANIYEHSHEENYYLGVTRSTTGGKKETVRGEYLFKLGKDMFLSRLEAEHIYEERKALSELKQKKLQFEKEKRIEYERNFPPREFIRQPKEICSACNLPIGIFSHCGCS